MNQDIAVVHWTEGGINKQAKAYTLQMLSQLIETMEKKGYVYVVNLTKLDTIIPTSSQKPFTATLTNGEYLGKVKVVETPYKPFREPTTIEQARVPPNRDEVRKAYGG